MDSDEVRGKEPSNHSSREMLPLPPPLRKGSGAPNPRKFGDHQSHLVRAAHPRHNHHDHDHQQERQAVKKQRRHSEQDMTKRTLDSRMQTTVKGEREEDEGEEEEELDVEDYGEEDDEEERGVSPPTQTENVPPPPPPSAPARYAKQGT